MKRQKETRKEFITVRVSEKEKTLLKQIADKSKKTIVEVLRDGGLSGKESIRSKDKRRIATFVEISIHLNKINNIIKNRNDIPDELRHEITELIKGEKRIWQS